MHHHYNSLLHAYNARLRRTRRAWGKCQNEGLCCLAAKDPGKFWRKCDRKREVKRAPTGISNSSWYHAVSSLLAPTALTSNTAALNMGLARDRSWGAPQNTCMTAQAQQISLRP